MSKQKQVVVSTKKPKVVRVKGPKPDFTPAFRLSVQGPRQRLAPRPSTFGIALANAALKKVDHPLVKRVCANLEDGVGAVRDSAVRG